MRASIVPTRGRLRLLRGTTLAAVSTLLGVLGHATAGGGVPDLGTIVVLGAVMTPLMIGLADRRARPLTLLLALGGTQLVLHALLQFLHGHPGGHVEPAPPLGMIAVHVAATAVSAILLAHLDQMIFAVAAGLARSLPSRPGVPAVPSRIVALLLPRSAPPGVLCPSWFAEGVGRRGPPVVG